MFRSPTGAGLPHIQTLVDDLPATRDQIAQHLDISSKTLTSYIKAGQAPRPVILSLFWESRWGRSAADTEAANWGALYYRQAKISERAQERMAGIIAALELELSCANVPGAAANSPRWIMA